MVETWWRHGGGIVLLLNDISKYHLASLEPVGVHQHGLREGRVQLATHLTDAQHSTPQPPHPPFPPATPHGSPSLCYTQHHCHHHKHGTGALPSISHWTHVLPSISHWTHVLPSISHWTRALPTHRYTPTVGRLAHGDVHLVLEDLPNAIGGRDCRVGPCGSGAIRVRAAGMLL